MLLRWSHYPRVCGPWFDSYPPRRAGSNSIAAFFKVWLITCRVTTVGAAPTTDLSAVQGSYPLCADSHRHLRACGPRMPPLPRGAGGLSYFTRHAGHLFAFLLFAECNLRRCGCPAVVAAFWAAKCHTSSAFHLSATQRNLKTTSVLAHVRHLSLCAITLADKARMFLALPLALWIAVWLVVRPAPPAALRRLMFPVSGHLNRRSFHDALLSQNDHGFRGHDRPLSREAWACMGCP